jgi:energy-coupling factor transporter ATP-binding protein EcfA2
MSTKQRIERLKFSTFRGATQPVEFVFRAENPVILIFGENGTGKSTIADALDFLCNGDFGSVRLRSGTIAKTHIVSALGRANDLEVEMRCGGKTWRAILQRGKPVTSPVGAPRAFVLRRADITRVMEATDSDRYKSLKEFITVPQIEQAENKLRAAYKAVSNEVDRAVSLKLSAEQTLERFWQAEGHPNRNYMTWARETACRSVDDMKQQIGQAHRLLQTFEDAVQAEQGLAAAASRLEQAQTEFNSTQVRFNAASQAQQEADLLDTLNAAKAYLLNHAAATACPVCGKLEPRASLLAQIENQLRQLQTLEALRQALAVCERQVRQAEGALDNQRQAYRSACSVLLSLLPTAPSVFRKGITLPTVEAGDEEIRDLLHKLTANRDALDGRIKQAEKVVAQHSALTTHLATIDDIAETMQDKHVLANRLKAMLAIVEEERKEFVQRTVDSISGTVSQLYRRIHPNEPLGEPTFSMKEKAIGSLSLTGKFGDNGGVPPAAYYSEAHLDTLGLCVYMALAKESRNALVVLDDVLMSIDDPHLDRVIELIDEEAPNFGHVIITTHSRAWFDRIRLGQGMNAELIELYGWNLNGGIRHSAAPLAVEELRAAVNAPRLDRQAVASRSGMLLEQLLDELTLRFNCSMPRKRPAEYTLGELSQGVDKKLRNLLRTEHLDASGTVTVTHMIYDLITSATPDSWIRNQVGAHFNPNATGISDGMVRQFGERVLALADALTCPHCKQLTRKNKSGSYWECGNGCGKIRLYPLMAP